MANAEPVRLPLSTNASLRATSSGPLPPPASSASENDCPDNSPRLRVSLQRTRPPVDGAGTCDAASAAPVASIATTCVCHASSAPVTPRPKKGAAERPGADTSAGNGVHTIHVARRRGRRRTAKVVTAGREAAAALLLLLHARRRRGGVGGVPACTAVVVVRPQRALRRWMCSWRALHRRADRGVSAVKLAAVSVKHCVAPHTDRRARRHIGL
eukprot:365661-Chlamydomonas_euryale.AAC.53